MGGFCTSDNIALDNGPSPVAGAFPPGLRVYIAGPMTGIENHNFPAFRAAAASLRAKGFEVASPLEINAEDAVPDKSWAECMRADLRELVGCDCVALLPGWHRSRGALLEHFVAQNVGVPCHPLDHYLKQPASGRTPENQP